MTVVEYDMRESDELAILRSHCQLEGRKLAISKMQRSGNETEENDGRRILPCFSSQKNPKDNSKKIPKSQNRLRKKNH